MAPSEVLSAILHYKRNIDKISVPPERALKHEDRLLHCINKLYKLPVNINHLQETGIGKTVNALRKIEGEKGLGDAAKALVAKWKTMVMLQDEADRRQREVPPSTSTEEDIKRIKLIRDAEKSHARETDDSKKDSRSSRKDHSDKSKEKYNSKKSKSEPIQDGKDRKRKLPDEDKGNNDNDGDSGRHHSKQKKKSSSLCEQEKVEEVTQLSTCNSHHVESKSVKSNEKKSDKTVDKDPSSSRKRDTSVERSDKKHESKTNSSSSSSKSKKHEVNHVNHEKIKEKKQKRSKDGEEDEKEEEEEGGIDSHSGATFAEALGPLIMRKEKKKKKFSHSVSVSQPEVSSEKVKNEKNDKKEKKEKNEKNEKNEKKQNNQIDINRPPTQPLEPNLVATLPVPTPHYKPSPVLNLPPQEVSRRRIQAEEDALKSIMSNKNQRTKVYSGVKGGLSYVPTLYEFCCRVLQQHLDAIEYTGGIPYSLLKPVLDGATPAQLFQFEHFNPYIIEDTDHLWKFHVNKEFRNESRQEFESWRDMYLRCIDEREEKYKAVKANIQKSIEQSAPVRKAKLAYIDIAKPPRSILRKQIKNGTSKPPASRLLGKDNPEAVRVPPPKQTNSKEPPSVKPKPKIAPLMQKTLKSIRMTRFKR